MRKLAIALMGAALTAAGCQRPAAVGAPAVTPAVDSVPAGLRAGTHEFEVDSVRLWYRVGGSAPADTPPLVFLHGGPGQGSAHFEVLTGPHLEPSLRVVYFDQRGSGRSGKPADGDYAIATLVEDIEALRRALGVDRIAVLGHSFGGILALEYAARYPRHVSHVIFVSGVWDMVHQCRLRLERLAALRPEAYARVRGDTLGPNGMRRSDCELEFRAFTSGAEREAFNTALMFPDPAVDKMIDSVSLAHGNRNTGELGRYLFRHGLLDYRFTAFDRLTMPTLVVAGRHDGAAVPAGLRELARRLPNARFVEYGTGHFVYVEEAEHFAREVAAFVRGASGAARGPFLGLRTAKYTARDLARAKAWYAGVLGIAPYFDQPFYVGFDVGGFELGITPDDRAGARRAEAGVAYWGVTNADSAFAHLLRHGASAHEPIQDVGDGVKIGSVWDPFGNVLGVVENPHFGVAAIPRDTLARELAEILERVTQATLVRRDSSELARATSSEFVVVPPAGLMEMREEALRGATNFRIDSTTLADVIVRREGSTAVLVGRRMLYGAVEARDPTGTVRRVDVTGPYRVLVVFAHDGATWKLLAQSLTPILGIPAR